MIIAILFGCLGAYWLFPILGWRGLVGFLLVFEALVDVRDLVITKAAERRRRELL